MIDLTKNVMVGKGVLASAIVVNTFMSLPTSATELGGMLKAQSSYQTISNEWQRHDWQLDLEMNTGLGEGEFTGIVRFLVDGEDQLNRRDSPDTYSSLASTRFDEKHGHAEMRELYWEYQGGLAYWKLGKQQVVWGEADGLKLLDVVNPQNYREFILDDFDDSRIPLWMLNAEFSVGDDSILQLLWIPDTSTHDLAPAGSPYELSSELQVPQPVPGISVNLAARRAPSKIFQDSDVGFRLSHYYAGWDMTFNYLYHYVDEPVLSAALSGTTVNIDQDFERSHLIGGSASNAFGDWTLRMEMAYETDRYHRATDTMPGVVRANQWGSVVGLDFQGWSDQFLSVQWFQIRTLANEASIIKSKTEDTVSLLWEANFLNETLTLSWLNLYSLDHHDGVSRPKISYNLYTNLDLILSADLFHGSDEGIFGQFDRSDRVSVGFEWGIN